MENQIEARPEPSTTSSSSLNHFEAVAIRGGRKKAEKRFLVARGRRYYDCKVKGFRYHGTEPEKIRQQQVVGQLITYVAEMSTEVDAGRGLLLSGPVGTGKDHFLVALARVAIRRYGYNVRWINGMDLSGAFRDQIGSGGLEREELSKYQTPDILVISDPLPIFGGLSDYQASTLYRIIDRRYNDRRPTWCSLNCTGPEEAAKRLGAATVDRLRDGAMSLLCNWGSYRTIGSQNERNS